jgi:hypothetical protein
MNSAHASCMHRACIVHASCMHRACVVHAACTRRACGARSAYAHVSCTHLLVVEATEQDDRHSEYVVRRYPSRVGRLSLEDKLVGAHLSQDGGGGGNGGDGGESGGGGRGARRGACRVRCLQGAEPAGCGVCSGESPRGSETRAAAKPGRRHTGAARACMGPTSTESSSWS